MIAAPGDTAKVCTKCKTDRPLNESKGAYLMDELEGRWTSSA